MIRYLRVYLVLLRLNLLKLIVYRANLANNILSSLLWGMLLFVSIFLLTSHSTSIYGISVAELMLITAGYNTMVGFFHCLFSGNFERLSQTIRYGELDTILLKPLDSHFLVSTQYINLISLVRVLLGVASLAYIIGIMHITVAVWQMLLFLGLLMFSLALLFSLWSIVTTLLIWFPRMQNIVDLMFSVTGFSRYPREMYQQLGSVFSVFFFPFTLILLVPVGALLQHVGWSAILPLLIVSIVFLLFAHLFWNIALRSYASASS